jgi:inner membrane protein
VIKLKYYEHISLGLFLAFILDYYYLNLLLLDKIYYYPLISIGCILPDIDTPKSKLGRIIPISHIIYKLVGHRTLTHSFIIILVVSAVASFIYGFNIVIFSVALGCILHVIGDLLTPQGVAIFYPLSKHRF